LLPPLDRRRLRGELGLLLGNLDLPEPFRRLLLAVLLGL
jgi:hypothetical protein